MEKGRASDLQKPLSLNLSFFLSLLLPYLPKPSNYSNEWLRARQREAVRDWENKWGEGGEDGRRFITAFYLLWVSLIPWPCADWSVKINSRDQMSGPGVLSVVIPTLWELMCGQVGMWIKMEMPLRGCSYPKHLLVVVVPSLTLCKNTLPAFSVKQKGRFPI